MDPDIFVTPRRSARVAAATKGGEWQQIDPSKPPRRKRQRVRVRPRVASRASSTSSGSTEFLQRVGGIGDLKLRPLEKERLVRILSRRETIRHTMEGALEQLDAGSLMRAKGGRQIADLRGKGRAWLDELHKEYPDTADGQLRVMRQRRVSRKMGRSKEGGDVVTTLNGVVIFREPCPDHDEVTRRTLERWEQEQSQVDREEAARPSNSAKNPFRRHRARKTKALLVSGQRSRAACRELEAGVLACLDEKEFSLAEA